MDNYNSAHLLAGANQPNPQESEFPVEKIPRQMATQNSKLSTDFSGAMSTSPNVKGMYSSLDLSCSEDECSVQETSSASSDMASYVSSCGESDSDAFFRVPRLRNVGSINPRRAPRCGVRPREVKSETVCRVSQDSPHPQIAFDGHDYPHGEIPFDGKDISPHLPPPTTSLELIGEMEHAKQYWAGKNGGRGKSVTTRKINVELLSKDCDPSKDTTTVTMCSEKCSGQQRKTSNEQQQMQSFGECESKKESIKLVQHLLRSTRYCEVCFVFTAIISLLTSLPAWPSSSSSRELFYFILHVYCAFVLFLCVVFGNVQYVKIRGQQPSLANYFGLLRMRVSAVWMWIWRLRPRNRMQSLWERSLEYFSCIIACMLSTLGLFFIVQNNSKHSLMACCVLTMVSASSMLPMLLLCFFHAEKVQVASQKASSFTSDLWKCKVKPFEAILAHIELSKAVSKLEQHTEMHIACVRRMAALGMISIIGVAQICCGGISIKLIVLTRSPGVFKFFRLLSSTLSAPSDWILHVLTGYFLVFLSVWGVLSFWTMRGNRIMSLVSTSADQLHTALRSLPISSSLRTVHFGQDFDSMLMYLQVVSAFGGDDNSELVEMLESLHLKLQEKVGVDAVLAVE
jgi:hypothetical protein